MTDQSPIRTPLSTPDSAIPDKLYFRIGEVARMCDVPAYVLRFWETEFPQLKPHKGETGQRLFRRRDVEMALRIRCLLYDEGYTIPGARQLLKSEQRQKESQLPLVAEMTEASLAEQLQHLRRELRELLTIVSKTDPATRPAVPRRLAAATALEVRTDTLFDYDVMGDEAGKDQSG